MVNNTITNIPQPARSILRNYPDIEAVAHLHDRYLAAVSSGDDGAIQAAQQHIEALLDRKAQIFDQRNPYRADTVSGTRGATQAASR